MESYDFSLDCAVTAKQGISMHLASPYQAVIHDFQLPDMNGIDLGRKLLQVSPDIPVVIMMDIDNQKSMGEAIDCGISMYVIKDEQDDYLGFVPGIMKSLLGRTEARRENTSGGREELSENESRFRDYSEISADWYWELDKNLRYTVLAPSFPRESSYKVSDFIGRLRSEVRPDGIEDALWQAHLEDLEAHRFIRNFIQPRSLTDGSVIWLSVNAKPAFDDGGVFAGYRGTATDITEQRQTEEKLYRQQLITEQAEQVAKFGHWMWDEVNDRCLHCSEGLARLRGMTVDQYMNLNSNSMGNVHRVHPDDLSRLQDSWNALRKSGEQYSAEYRFLLQSDEIRWAREVGSSLAISETGEVLSSVGITYDITDTRAVEERLRKSEERYRQVADASSDWVWEMDADLRFSYLSSGYHRLIKVDPSLVIGKQRHEIVDPEEMEKSHWQEHMADLEAHQDFRGFQYEFIDTDGKVFQLQISGSVIFDKDGVFQGYRGTATDVTGSVMARRDLAESTEKLQHAVKLARLGYYHWDGIAKKTVSCTEEFANIHGVSAEEYISQTDSFENLLNWIHPDDRGYYIERTSKAAASQSTLEVEYRIITPDGQVRYVHEDLEPEYDKNGELIKTTGAMLDITERKETEASLTEAEELASLGNWQWSVEQKRLVSWSGGFARVLGIAMDEVPVYMTRPGITLIHAEDRERLDRLFVEAIEKCLDYETEYRIVRPDGEIRDIHEIHQAIIGADGLCHQTKGTIQDITEQKTIEREITKAKNDAEEANRAKSEFLSSMSHELRTPLNAILGFAQLMTLKSKDPLTKSQKKSVDHIVRGGNHLLDLITQVLDFARIETGQIGLEMETLDLTEVLADCLSVAESLAESRGIKVIDHISKRDLPPVEIDQMRVKQILLNLISNGIKYNREGGTLTLSAEVLPEQMLRISVMDTGFGIDKEFHGQVFEAFSRLGRESQKIEGTGIGLTISKQLIELMGGQIGFTSEVNIGTSFSIDLPLFVAS